MRGQCGVRQKIPVGFINDQPDAALPAQGREPSNHVGRIDRPSRIIGTDQHHGAGPIRHQCRRPPRIRHKPILRSAWQRQRFQPLHRQCHGVVEVPGYRQHHLIANAAQNGHRHGERQIRAGGDGHVGRIQIGAIDSIDVGGQGRSQRLIPVDRAVAGLHRRRRPFGQTRREVWVRRIARHRLGQVDDRAGAPVIAVGPGLGRGDGSREGRANTGGERRGCHLLSLRGYRPVGKALTDA